MRTLTRSTLRPAGWLVLAAVTACGGAPETKPPASPKPAVVAPAKVAPVADEPAPVLRTGPREPLDLGTGQGEVVGRFDDGAIETLEVLFRPPSPKEETGLLFPEVLAEASGLSSFTEPASLDEADGRYRIWVRRPKGTNGPIRVTLVGEEGTFTPPTRFVVTAAAPTKPADPKLRARFATALAEHFERRGATVFGADAAARVRRAYAPEKKGPATATRLRANPAAGDVEMIDRDMASLMRATTGLGAMRAALASDRTLAVARPQAPSVAVTSLQAPQLDVHPWAAMHAKLGVKAPREPLAELAPADGWYVRAGSLGALFRLLDEADAWGTSAARLAEEVAFDAEIATRYETQLGLRRSELARRFGDRVVGEVAIVGSDPYVREGTDVTLLFRLEQTSLFDGALAESLADRAAGHGALETKKITHEGVEISIVTSADGAVRRHRADVGDVAIVSNSLGATKRVISTAKGKHPALAKEPDIGYALARDASEPSDVVALISERFVRSVLSPAHKIAEARRMTARGELLAPGVAAVLHGWLRGAPPASTDALVATRLLDEAELTHSGGGAIRFTPGRAPRSAWGTPAFMEPLVDRPAVEKVTPGERDAYERFRRSYEEGWAGEPFDPIAVRLALADEGPMVAHVRVLPIPRDRDMDDLMRIVGDERLVVEPTASGARLVVGLSGDERWRRELGLDLGRMIGGERRVLDWIGSWAAIGVADRNGLLNGIRPWGAPESRPPNHARGDDELLTLTHLPIWVGVEVRSPATLGILLTVVRKLADDVIPGMVRWGEIGKEGAVPVVGVRVAGDAVFGREAEERNIDVFYAIVPATKGAQAALYASLKEDLVRQLVRDHVAGRGPRAPTGKQLDASSAQAFIDLAAARGGAIATLLNWAAEDAARDQQRSSSAFAEWFLRAGAPGTEAELARAYIGAVPTTPSGKAYTWGPGGVTDPDRGSIYAPTWPAIPVAGTPMAAIVEAIARARITTSFENEPLHTEAKPLRSFTARITIDKR